MSVLSYLECGCCILTNGRRVMCPTCDSPPKAAVAPDYDALAARHAALREAAREYHVAVEELAAAEADGTSSSDVGHAERSDERYDNALCSCDAARARLLAELEEE